MDKSRLVGWRFGKVY